MTLNPAERRNQTVDSFPVLGHLHADFQHRARTGTLRSTKDIYRDGSVSIFCGKRLPSVFRSLRRYLNSGVKLLPLFILFAGAAASSTCRSDGNPQSYRTIDGSGNNLKNPQMNRAETRLVRLAPPAYADGISSFAGPDRPNPREISNIVNKQEELIPNRNPTTNFMWLWGQFTDHDMTLSDEFGSEPVNIEIPTGDPVFDPQGTGTAEMSFHRSMHDHEATGTSEENPRQQLNEVTGWIDGSTVYGSYETRAAALRTNDGQGRLRTSSASSGNFPPYNDLGLLNFRFRGPEFFIAGDIRANENIGLVSLHTLFLREHNRLAEEIAARDPSLSGEEIYQRARRMVGALIQSVTYNEFLPLLLGPDALPPYSHYNDSIDAGIANVFSSAAFRVGHTLLDPKIRLLTKEGSEIEAIELRNAFFELKKVVDFGIEPILRGFATDRHQRVDAFIIDEVRNFLFVDAMEPRGFDLPALNIQRGRDHGLPSYNDMREALGLERKERFSDITSDPEVVKRLRRAYGTTDDMDIWVAGVAEDPHGESMLGELFHTIISRQFKVLRDGDRFWYERILSPDELRQVEETKLADIIRRNTDIGNEIGDNVFFIE